MFNRCSGLLLARELLRKSALSSEEADFIGRNLAKMQLALGDAVLTAFGQYHWSAWERHRRLAGFDSGWSCTSWFAEDSSASRGRIGVQTASAACRLAPEEFDL